MTKFLTIVNGVQTLVNDGIGSLLDADLLDGQEGSFYQNASNLNDGTIPAARISGQYTGFTRVGVGNTYLTTYSSTDTDITALVNGSTTGTLLRGLPNAHVGITVDPNDPTDSFWVGSANPNGDTSIAKPLDRILFRIRSGGDVSFYGSSLTAGDGSYTIWHSGNDGAGSLMDADKLDGVEGSAYAQLATSQTFTGVKTFSAGVIPGASIQYPNYSVRAEFYGAEGVGTWKRLVSVASPSGNYCSILFRVEVTDCQKSTGYSGTPDLSQSQTYYVTCVRTNLITQDSPDNCEVRGVGNLIRAVKISTGNYEIQMQPEGSTREYRVDISVVASNQAHTVTYRDADSGSSGVAQYSASVGNSIDRFQNIAVAKGVIQNGLAQIINSAKPTTRDDGSALVVGDRWYYTTENSWWFWNGTYWLSEQVLYLNYSVETASATVGLLDSRPINPAGYDLFAQTLSISAELAAGTYDGSNNWQLKAFARDSSATFDTSNTIKLCTINSYSAERLVVDDTSNIHKDVSAANTKGIFLRLVKTGTPPNLSYVFCSLAFRWAYPDVLTLDFSAFSALPEANKAAITTAASSAATTLGGGTTAQQIIDALATCVAWVDWRNSYTDVGATTLATNGSLVAAIKEYKSGGIFTQATSGNRPTMTADGVQFASGKRLGRSLAIGTPTAFTVISALKALGSTSYNAYPYLLTNSNLAAPVDIWDLNVYRNGGGSPSFTAQTNVSTLTNKSVLAYALTDASFKSRLNAATLYTVSGGSQALSYSSATENLCSRGDGVTAFNGLLHQVLVFGSDITGTATETRVRAFINAYEAI